MTNEGEDVNGAPPRRRRPPAPVTSPVLLAVLDEAGEVNRCVRSRTRTFERRSYSRRELLRAPNDGERIGVRRGCDESQCAGHALVRNKAVSRQYHTWFEWRGSNANSFFGLFGSDFRDFMKARIRRDGDLDDSVARFSSSGESGIGWCTRTSVPCPGEDDRGDSRAVPPRHALRRDRSGGASGLRLRRRVAYDAADVGGWRGIVADRAGGHAPIAALSCGPPGDPK